LKWERSRAREGKEQSRIFKLTIGKEIGTVGVKGRTQRRERVNRKTSKKGKNRDTPRRSKRKKEKNRVLSRDALFRSRAGRERTKKLVNMRIVLARGVLGD